MPWSLHGVGINIDIRVLVSFDNLGPVVRSTISLTKSLVSDMLSLLLCIKSSVLIVLLKKM